MSSIAVIQRGSGETFPSLSPFKLIEIRELTKEYGNYACFDISDLVNGGKEVLFIVFTAIETQTGNRYLRTVKGSLSDSGNLSSGPYESYFQINSNGTLNVYSDTDSRKNLILTADGELRMYSFPSNGSGTVVNMNAVLFVMEIE